jgi:DNA primase
MGKLAQATSKYTIYAKFEAEGTVEKPDVIGAVFGQTEGLLGPDMELRELQKTGRIGRIDVEMKNNNGKTSGIILIPSSLDSSETALIAACIETIERVGPCNAKLSIEQIEDVRTTKRKYVIDRAKELLGKMFDEGMGDSQQIAEQIKEAVRSSEVSDYLGLPAGPNIESYDSIIIVEGRADVVNLLKNGIKNVVAIEGTSVPKPAIDLSKEKVITAFLDGDRGGDLILKELLSVCEIDFVARAPKGKEVEELGKKEIFKCLREKAPTDQMKPEIAKTVITTEEAIEVRPKIKNRLENNKVERFKTILEDLIGTRAACFLDDELEILGRVPTKEMFSAMRQLDADAILLDGDIDQKLVNQCSLNGIKYIIGMKVGRVRTPEGTFILSIQDLK